MFHFYLPKGLRRFIQLPVYGFYAAKTRLRDPFQYIFILGHMRAGSTLFSHILASHPAIRGYGETHLEYEKPAHLDRLAYKVMFMTRATPSDGQETYVMDKVLHDYLLAPERAFLLCRPEARIIFLMREPRGTMFSMHRTLGMADTAALASYTGRLASLVKMAHTVTEYRTAFFVTFDQLVHQTQQVFPLVQKFLELDVPLSEEYQLNPMTMVPGTGDISDNLRSGKIRPKAADEAPPGFSEDAIAEAQGVYVDTKRKLSELCLHLDT